MSAINFIAAQAQSLAVGELTFTIEPVRMGQMPALLRAIEPVLTEVYFLAAQDRVSPDRLLGLCATSGDELLQAVAIMARAERSVIDQLLPDQFAALALLCVEVNQDFFSKALPSILAQAPSLAPSVHSALGRAVAPRAEAAPNANPQPTTPATGPVPLTS